MEWLWHGPVALTLVIGLLVVLFALNLRIQHKLDRGFDGKAALDETGKPELGTEAVDRAAFARGLNRLRWHQRAYMPGGAEIKAMGFYPEQSRQENDLGYAERFASGAVHPVKGETET